MMRTILVGLVTSVIVAISSPLARADSERCVPAAGELDGFIRAPLPRTVTQAPFFENDETERTLQEFAGQGLVLNFWATWCQPCITEMPSLARLAALLKGDGVTVLALSEDRGGGAKVKAFLEKTGLTELGVFLDRNGLVSRKMVVGGLPTTLLIDAQGKEVGRLVGVAQWDDPRTVAFLRRCLAPRPALTPTP